MYNVSSSCDKEPSVSYVGFADNVKKEQLLSAIKKIHPASDFSECTFYIIDGKPTLKENRSSKTAYIARKNDSIVVITENNGNFSINFIYF